MADQILGRDELLQGLEHELPVNAEVFEPAFRTPGLVIVDEVNGFATVGAGNLAPPVPNSQVSGMVDQTTALARRFVDAGQPILAFLDTHEPGVPEPPYPPHCERGTGEEDLVPELAWLETAAGVTLIRKDCINGFVGAIDGDGRNRFVDWCGSNDLDTLLVVGICTDICVMDFVLTVLSARNHGMLHGVKDVWVYAPGCATYDLPREAATGLDLPPTAAHPQSLTHHIGLYMMASRGARVASEIG